MMRNQLLCTHNTISTKEPMTMPNYVGNGADDSNRDIAYNKGA